MSEAERAGRAKDQAEAAAEAEVKFGLDLFHRLEQTRLGMTADRHRREMALIDERFDHERAQILVNGDLDEKTRKMRLNGVEALRKAEKEAAEHRHRVEKLQATKQRVERRMEAEKDLKWEIERLEIEKSAMPERAKQKALLALEEERALEEAKAAGIDPGLVRRKYALMGRDVLGETRERFSVTGTFNALVAGRLAAGGAAERTAKATEEAAGHLKHIRRRFEYTGPTSSGKFS